MKIPKNKAWLIGGRKPKLTPEQVRKAREWAAIGLSMSQAAAHFGVHRTVFRDYLNGKHKRMYE